MNNVCLCCRLNIVGSPKIAMRRLCCKLSRDGFRARHLHSELKGRDDIPLFLVINPFWIWTPSRATKCNCDETSFPSYSEEVSMPDLTKILRYRNPLSLGWLLAAAERGDAKCVQVNLETMDQISIKTPNPKCRLFWCLVEFIDWRYSQSVGIVN